jgi:hypothetical protein
VGAGAVVGGAGTWVKNGVDAFFTPGHGPGWATRATAPNTAPSLKDQLAKGAEAMIRNSGVPPVTLKP